MTGPYGAAQARIHHERFGDLARSAAALLLARLAAAGLDRGTVTDLGCGSGILAAALGDAGYDVVAYDLSPAMVDLARAVAPRADVRAGSYLDAAIPPSVAVAAIGEVCCYASDPRAGLEAVRALAARARAALVPGGVLLLDVSTPGRNLGTPVRHVFHDADTWSLGMRAVEDGDRLDRHIAIFERGPDGRYRRTDEHHVLHLYDAGAVHELLTRAGFDVERRAAYAGDTASTPPSGWAVFAASVPAPGGSTARA